MTTAPAGELSDRLNPIVVKELRQAARGRFLVGIFFVLLLLQLVNLGGQLLAKGISQVDLLTDAQAGRDVAVGATLMLVLTAVFAVPIATGVRLLGERAHDGLDLLFVTALSPRRIVAGKLASSLVLVLLLFSATAPFLAFTYFLRGVDVAVLALVLTGDALAALLAVLAAIAGACANGERGVRVLVALGTLLAIAIGTIFTMVWTAVFLSGEERLVGAGGLRGALLVLVLLVAAAGFLFELAVALVTPPVADRAKPLRTYLSSVFVLSAALVWLVEASWPDGMLWEIWAASWVDAAGLAFLVAASAPDRPSRRLLREAPRDPLRRRLAFLLTSGSANGFAWAVALLLATLAVGLAGASRRPGPELFLTLHALAGTGGFFLFYATFGYLLHRAWLARRIPAGLAWVVGLVLLAIGIALPPVLVLLHDPSSLGVAATATIANPWGTFSETTGLTVTRTGLALGLLALAFLVPTIVGGFRAYRRPEQPAGELEAPAGGDATAAAG